MAIVAMAAAAWAAAAIEIAVMEIGERVLRAIVTMERMAVRMAAVTNLTHPALVSLP